MIGPEFAVVLAAAQGGDGAAFGRLWRDANPALVRYLRTLAGPAGEDLASETWLGVMRGLPRFRGDEAQFRGWLFTIGRHKLVDAHRKDRSGLTQPLDTLGSGREPVTADTADLAEVKMSTDRALAVIATLPADQAEVILLRVVAGLDTATVAHLMGKSQGAIRVAAHRGLRRLAERIGEAAVTVLVADAFPNQDA